MSRPGSLNRSAHPSTARTIVVALWCAAAPVLMFPEPVLPVAAWLPPSLAVTLGLATLWLSRHDRALGWLAALLGVAVVSGWTRADSLPGITSHGTNAMLGLSTALLIAHVVPFTQPLPVLRMLLVFALVGLGYGTLAADFPEAKFFWVDGTDRAPVVPGLPGLPTSGLVNHNALGAVAVTALPIAWAVARNSPRAWRAVALGTGAAGFAVILVTQSLSVWFATLSIAVVGIVQSRRTGRLSLLASAAVAAMATWSVATLVPDRVQSQAHRLSYEFVDSSLSGIATLIEHPTMGEHGIAAPVVAEAGLYTITAIVRPLTRTGIALRADGNGARFELSTGAVEDYGQHTAWLEPIGEGWWAARQVIRLPSGPLRVELTLLDTFPRGTRFGGTGQASLELRGVWLEPARSWRDTSAAVAVLARGAIASSLATRLEIWHQGIQLLRRDPWSGIGLGMFRWRFVPEQHDDETNIAGRSAHAHNIFLQTALDVGVPGLLAYLGLLGLGITRALRAAAHSAPQQSAANAVLLVLAGLHLFGLTDAVALGAKVGLLGWSALGIALGLHGRSVARTPD